MSPARIAYTVGEPAGIGPDLAVHLAQSAWPVELVVLTDPQLLMARAQQLQLPLHWRLYDAKQPPQAQPAGTLTVLPIAYPAVVQPGQLQVANSASVVESLALACDGCMRGEFAAVMTGPVHKGVINDAGIPFSGHTEFFAERSGSAQVVMLLATEGLRVALATTHLPLAQVAAAITVPRLTAVLTTLAQALKERFAIAKPSILVCGLNPHAGEQGHLGREEIEVIEPTLKHLQKQGLDVRGPFPADTLFQPRYLEQADAVLAMYHDQGLPVLKFKGFGRAANITLGLPFIRTSVDHGTALDLAGSDQVDSGSAYYALQTAIEMASS